MVAKAGDYDLKLVLSLTNYWDAYGGMEEYVKWAHGANSTQNLTITEFYTSPEIKEMYKSNFLALKNRFNRSAMPLPPSPPFPWPSLASLGLPLLTPRDFHQLHQLDVRRGPHHLGLGACQRAQEPRGLFRESSPILDRRDEPLHQGQRSEPAGD